MMTTMELYNKEESHVSYYNSSGFGHFIGFGDTKISRVLPAFKVYGMWPHCVLE